VSSPAITSQYVGAYQRMAWTSITAFVRACFRSASRALLLTAHARARARIGQRRRSAWLVLCTDDGSCGAVPCDARGGHILCSTLLLPVMRRRVGTPRNSSLQAWIRTGEIRSDQIGSAPFSPGWTREHEAQARDKAAGRHGAASRAGICRRAPGAATASVAAGVGGICCGRRPPKGLRGGRS
jgi:hypothetical protein